MRVTKFPESSGHYQIKFDKQKLSNRYFKRWKFITSIAKYNNRSKLNIFSNTLIQIIDEKYKIISLFQFYSLLIRQFGFNYNKSNCGCYFEIDQTSKYLF